MTEQPQPTGTDVKDKDELEEEPQRVIDTADASSAGKPQMADTHLDQEATATQEATAAQETKLQPSSEQLRHASFTVIKAEALRLRRLTRREGTPPNITNEAEQALLYLGMILASPLEDPDHFDVNTQRHLKLSNQEKQHPGVVEMGFTESESLPRLTRVNGGYRATFDKRRTTADTTPSAMKPGDVELQTFRGKGMDGRYYFVQNTEPHGFSITEDELIEAFFLACSPQIQKGLKHMDDEGRRLGSESVLRTSQAARGLVTTMAENATTYIKDYPKVKDKPPELLKGIQTESVESALESTSTSRGGFLAMAENMRRHILSDQDKRSKDDKDEAIRRLDALIESLGNGIQPTAEQILGVLTAADSTHLQEQYNNNTHEIQRLEQEALRLEGDKKAQLEARIVLMKKANGQLNMLRGGSSGTGYHSFVAAIARGEVDPAITSRFNTQLRTVTNPSSIFGEHNPEQEGTIANMAKDFLREQGGNDFDDKYGVIMKFLHENGSTLMLMFLMISLETAKATFEKTVQDAG